MNDEEEDSLAIFSARPGRYVSRIWFIGHRDDMDWMAWVYRDGDGPWQLTYRFRYYNSPDPFDPDDRKVVTHATFANEVSEEKVLSSVDMIAQTLHIAMFADNPSTGLSVVDVRSSDPEKLAADLAAQPWCHVGSVFGGPADLHEA